MGYQLLTSRLVKHSRKEFYCVYCGEKIDIGDTCIYMAYVFHGDFRGDRYHSECAVAAAAAGGEYNSDDGFEEGSFVRGEPRLKDEC